MKMGVIKRAGDLLAWLFLSEPIPPPEGGEAAVPVLRKPSVWRGLLAAEPLPTDPPPASASGVSGPSFVRRLLSREPLAADPPPADPPPPALILRILARETLPRDPLPARRARRALLDVLLSPEQLDGPRPEGVIP